MAPSGAKDANKHQPVITVPVLPTCSHFSSCLPPGNGATSSWSLVTCIGSIVHTGHEYRQYSRHWSRVLAVFQTLITCIGSIPDTGHVYRYYCRQWSRVSVVFHVGTAWSWEFVMKGGAAGVTCLTILFLPAPCLDQNFNSVPGT